MESTTFYTNIMGIKEDQRKLKVQSYILIQMLCLWCCHYHRVPRCSYNQENELSQRNREKMSTQNFTFVMGCAVWYHLCNIKNVTNTYGGVLLLVKFTQSNTPRGCNMFFKLYKGTKSRKSSHFIAKSDTALFMNKIVFRLKQLINFLHLFLIKILQLNSFELQISQ